jgi:glucose/arabinose dehydrogenase
VVEGLKNPWGIAVAIDGKTYVTTRGEVGKDGDGAVFAVEDGKATSFATGLDDPTGIVTWSEWVFVADKKRVWRIDKAGKAVVFVAAEAFPRPPAALTDLDVDEEGRLYAVDAASDGKSGAVYRVDPKGNVQRVVDGERTPEVRAPAGVATDGYAHLLVSDSASGTLFRIKLADGTAARVADDCGGALAWDRFGRLYASNPRTNRLSVVPRPGDKPVMLAADLAGSAIRVDASGKNLLMVDGSAGAIRSVPAAVPGQPVDETPLPVETAVAFPDLQWAGWKGENDKGQIAPLRPLVLTHAGDGSNRVFVATEQ